MTSPPQRGGSAAPAQSTSRPATRQGSSSKRRSDIISDSQSRIKDASDGRSFLESKEYLVPGEKVTMASLGTALLYITQAQDMPQWAVDSIRSVALCIGEAMADSIVERLVESVTEAVESKHGTLSEAINDAAENTSKVIAEIKNSCEEAVQKLASTARKTPQAPAAPTYAGVLQANLGAAAALGSVHYSIVAKGQLQEKQVLVEKAPGVESNGLKDLTERMLIEKAKLALDRMGRGAEDRPEGMEFVAATKLRNGGVVYDMSSVEAARWLRKDDVKRSFLQGYDSQAIIKNRIYLVVAEFVPCSLGDPMDARAVIEGGGKLRTGEVVHAKWIKNPIRRKPGQQSAHLIVGCGTREGANLIIKDGLVIEGKKVSVRKLDQEPRRCLKCQFFGKGHVAADCKSVHETCGTCAGMHRSSECTIDDPAQFICVNCRDQKKPHDHASWDRECPSFVDHRAAFSARHPEQRYKFFPSEDPATWVRQEDDPSSATQPPAQGRTLARSRGVPPSSSQPVRVPGSGEGSSSGGRAVDSHERGVGRGRLSGGMPGGGGGVSRSRSRADQGEQGSAGRTRQGTLDGWRRQREQAREDEANRMREAAQRPGWADADKDKGVDEPSEPLNGSE